MKDTVRDTTREPKIIIMAARARSSSAKEGKESEKDDKQQTFHNPVFRPRANLLEVSMTSF